MIAATTLTLALLVVSGCSDPIGLAHGDPGRDHGLLTPPAPSAAAAVPARMSNGGNTAVNSADHVANAAALGPFSAVTVTLGEHARQLAAADPRLSATAVAAAVEHELAVQHLLAPGSAAPRLGVTVEDFASTLASNAVVLGYTFRKVMLLGEVAIPGPAAPPPIEIHARARLTTRGAGANAGSLGPLYARFAQLVVAGLRGVKPPADDAPR
jgi:hypothetical protein